MEIFFLHPLITLAAAFVTAFLFSYLSFPAIHQIAKARFIYGFTSKEGEGLVVSFVPSLGGIAFFAGFFISAAYFVPGGWGHYLLHLLASLMILFMAGMKADMLAIQPFSRLIAVIAAMVISVEGIGSWYPDLVRLGSGIPRVPILPVLYKLPLLVLTIYIFFTFNRIGRLASLMALLLGALALVWFGLSHNKPHAVMAMAFLGAQIPLVIHEWVKNKKVMPGQAGILMSSFLIGIFLMEISRHYSYKPQFMHNLVNPLIPVCLFLFTLAILIRVFRKVPSGAAKSGSHQPRTDGPPDKILLASILSATAVITSISFFFSSQVLLVMALVVWLSFILFFIWYSKRARINSEMT